MTTKLTLHTPRACVSIPPPREEAQKSASRLPPPEPSAPHPRVRKRTNARTHERTMPRRTNRKPPSQSRRSNAREADDGEHSDASSCSASSSSQTSLFGAIEDGDLGDFNECIRDDPTCVMHVNKNGWTAVHQAAYSGEAVMLAKLIELGVDVNAKCADGDLAVHYASAQGEKKCIELLAKAGSELETKDNDGETPMQVSHVRVREILAELIVAARRAKTAC